jgi:hydrogenase nickel incorporation protein HypA/HybF
MNEQNIAASALRQTLDYARRTNSEHVNRVVFNVGDMSGVDPEGLRFAFRSLSAGSPAARAQVEVRRVAGSATCSKCGHVFPTRGNFVPPCPKCSSPAGEVQRSQELHTVQLELE